MRRTREGAPAPDFPPVTRWGSIWRWTIVVLLGLMIWVSLMVAIDAQDMWSTTTRVWLFLIEPLLMAASFVVLRQRRRHPVTAGIVIGLLATLCTLASGAAFLVLGSVATRRRTGEIALVGGVHAVMSVVVSQWHPVAPVRDELPASIITAVVMVAITVAVGYAVGSRRDALAARVTATRAEERARIAREMHDVLAHRISLVAMHAGALTYRDDLTRDEQLTAARTIETNAQEALRELRDILGVLRDPTLPDAPLRVEPPQPGLADLPSLVSDATTAGMALTVEDTTQGEVPSTVGRTAYRIIQEALTNARKHAPGSPVTIRLSGGPEQGLHVRVANPRPARQPELRVPGSGLGLVGMSERAALVGGRLEHGRDGDGGYLLTAQLPWPA